MAENTAQDSGKYLPGVIVGIIAGAALWYFTYQMLVLAK